MIKPACCTIAVLAALAASPAAAQTKFVAVWAASADHVRALDDAPALAPNTTLRVIITPDALGHTARFRIANLLGTAPLTIDDASVSLTLAGAATSPHTGHGITFRARKTITIAPGDVAWSDPVTLNFIGLPTDSRILGHALSISLHIPGAPVPLTWSAGGESFASAAGASQAASDAETPFTQRLTGTLLVDAMDIMAPKTNQVVAVVGERLGPAGLGWTGMLARRVHVVAEDRASLVDLTRGDARIAGLTQQLDRDLPSGTSSILLVAGLSDVADGRATPEAAAEALASLARRTRARLPGIKLLGATLPPAPEGVLPADADRSRRALNQFIRLTDVFDGVVDFDAALADPDTGWLRAAFARKGERLADYPGQLALADAVDLKTLIKATPPAPPPAPKPAEDAPATN